MGDMAFGVVLGASVMVGLFAAWRVVVDEHWTRPGTLEEWIVRPVTFLAVAGQVAVLTGAVLAGVVVAADALVGGA
jgi:hypothetical protein